MAVLTLEQIANADDRSTETLPVPEWGGEIVLRCISEQQLDDINAAAQVDGDVDQVKWKRLLLAATIAEPAINGEAGVALLADKSATVMIRLLKAVLQLNGLDGGKEAAANAEASFPEGRPESDDVPVGA